MTDFLTLLLKAQNRHKTSYLFVLFIFFIFSSNVKCQNVPKFSRFLLDFRTIFAAQSDSTSNLRPHLSITINHLIPHSAHKTKNKYF